MKLSRFVLFGIVIAMILITSGCTQKETNDKGETNQNGIPEEQVEMTNGQLIVNDYKDFQQGTQTRAFNSSTLIAAEDALAKGIKIDDPQNDWVRTPDTIIQHDNKPDNINPYPLPWTDLKSVSIGADTENIYFKFEFWGNFPRELLTYEGDRILGGGCDVKQLTFGLGEYDWAQLQISIQYTDSTNESQVATTTQLNHEAMISPTGESDENGEEVYSIFSREGMIDGGADTNYLLASYPLKLFGLQYGDMTTFNLGAEFTSDTYHHVAKENLLDIENPLAIQGETIQYVIGSNNYTKLGVPAGAYLKPSDSLS